jgi:hypothetical protein
MSIVLYDPEVARRRSYPPAAQVPRLWGVTSNHHAPADDGVRVQMRITIRDLLGAEWGRGITIRDLLGAEWGRGWDVPHTRTDWIMVGPVDTSILERADTSNRTCPLPLAWLSPAAAENEAPAEPASPPMS